MSNTNSATLTATLDGGSNGAGNVNFSTLYNASPLYAQQIMQSNMTRGLEIGSRTEILGSGGLYTYTIKYYDVKGHISQEQNINVTQGRDVTSVQYDWSGKKLFTLASNNKGGATNNQTHNVMTSNSYDAVGRLLSITKTINSSLPGGLTPDRFGIGHKEYGW